MSFLESFSNIIVDAAKTVAHTATDVATTVVNVAETTAEVVARTTTEVTSEVVNVAEKTTEAIANTTSEVVSEVGKIAVDVGETVAGVALEGLGVVGPVLVPEMAADEFGSCILLPNVNKELSELKRLKLSVGEVFPGSSTSLNDSEKYRWMEYYGLGVLPIYLIVWPGTHDSATYGIGSVLTRPFAECQSLTIYEQLRNGVRVLDVRIKDDLSICHGDIVASFRVDTVLNHIKKFVSETKLEIFILEITTEFGHSDPPNMERYLVDQLGGLLIHQNDDVFLKNIHEVQPGRIICIWKPRNSPSPKAGGPIWNADYLRGEWIDTDMPLTKFNGNFNNLRAQSPVSGNKFFYRIEHTLTAQTDNKAEFIIYWTKHVSILLRRIRPFNRLFLAKCHKEGILDKLQIISTDFVNGDFVNACIQLCSARLTMVDHGPGFTIGARDLYIVWGDDSRYWQWSWINESDKQMEVAELLQVYWFEVAGKFEISKLSQGITYEVIFVIMLRDSLYGFKAPLNLRLTLPNGTTQDRTENVNGRVKGQWIQISAGKVKISPGMVGIIQFSMKDTDVNSEKRGLTIKHVLITPTNK